MTSPAVMSMALRRLAEDIESEDGVANACCADAAEMIDEAVIIIRSLSTYVTHSPERHQCPGCQVLDKAVAWLGPHPLSETC